MTGLFIYLLSIFCLPAATAGQIIDRLIPFGPAREALTLDYIRRHYDPNATNTRIAPQMVIVHWTGGGTLAGGFATFAPDRLPSVRADIKRGGLLNVSAHFLVGRSGQIYRLMPENRLARHTIGLNWTAIGIENIGGPKAPLTDAQLLSNAWLVRDLTKRHAIGYLLGHFEYGRFRGSAFWRERVPGYFTGKSDPGATFMKRLRAELADLDLKAVP